MGKGKDSNLREMLAMGRQRAGRGDVPEDQTGTDRRTLKPKRVTVKLGSAELDEVRRAVLFLRSYGYPDIGLPDVLDNAIRRHMAELKEELNSGRDFPEEPPPERAAHLGYGTG